MSIRHINLIRSACLTNYVEVARSVDLDPYQQLNAVGISRSALLDPDIKIRVDAVGRLLEASATAARVDDFGLRMAETRQLSNLGPIGFAAREEPTLRMALNSMARLLRLHNEALYLRIEERDGIVVIREDFISDHSGSTRQAMELALGVLYRILRWFLGTSWRPRSICFSHSAPKNLATHLRVFGASVEFLRDFDGIVCLASDLDMPNPMYDPVMAGYVRRYLESIFVQPNATMSDQVRQLVCTLLPAGHCSIDRVAQHLGVDRRTVHRHLASSDETFSSIVEAVRTELATRHIESRGRPLSQVATLLGFSSLSAFSRWFRGRFGCSVSTWRTARTQGKPGT